MGKTWPLVLAVVLGLGLAIRATTPPAPILAGSPPAQFSADLAMEDVRVVAREPHITDTEQNAAVREYLTRRMQALGMATSTEQGTVNARGTEKRNRWTGRNDPPATLTNVIGVLPGKNPDLPAVLLMAHHDSVWGSPGAADDAAGVAAALEVVRAVKDRGQPPRDLIVLLTDAEELGLQGARLFFASNPLRSRVGAVINMEARGGGGRTTLFQTSRQNGAAARFYAGAVNAPGASSLSAFVYSVLPNDTDLTPVIKGPYLAYNFAFIGRSGLYHSPMATPDRLDQGALQDMGAQVLDLTDALVRADQLPDKAADAVFFDLFGLTTVTYPAWLGWILLGMAGAAFGAVLRRAGPAGAGSGALRMLGLIALSAVLLYAFNRLSLGLGPSNYYDRLEAIARLEWIAAFAGLGSFLLVFGKSRLDRSQIAGAALPLLALATIAQVAAPTAAYVLTLPLLVVGLGMALSSMDGARWVWPVAAVLAVAALGVIQLSLGELAVQSLRLSPWLLLAVLLLAILAINAFRLGDHAVQLFACFGSALVLGYLIALGHQLMQGVGPTMPSAAALPIALGALAVLPLWQGLTRQQVRGAACAALLAAGAIALWVQLDEPAPSRAVYSDTKK